MVRSLHQVVLIKQSLFGPISWKVCSNTRKFCRSFIVMEKKIILVLFHFRHGDAIQCVSFNPLSQQLASCSLTDFAIWSPEQKAVQKHKIGVRVNCCAWTNDGQYIALGLMNGIVSIRNKAGEEKSKIERPGGANSPIYSLAWNPPVTGSSADLLCVVDWGQTLSFYSIGGQIVGKERPINFDALCITYFPDGEAFVVAGCNKSVQLFSKDGIALGTLGEMHESWIWSVAIHPHGNAMVLACHNGSLAFYSLVSSTVHALYRERYAFRENCTDVIIQHLLSGQKVRIKCRDLVQKIAIYRNRLAVQIPERVIIYELSSGENQPMHYRVKEKISKRFECSLLVVCSQNIVLCQEKRLQSLDFNGTLEREWTLDSFIRYIKVIGGKQGKEGLLVGLKSGQVWKIFLDNSLPILITTALSSVRCLDINRARNKLAIVDDAGRLTVRDLLNDVLMYQDVAVNSVAWNTHHDTMICYSHTTGKLSVRVGNHLPPTNPQSLVGVVVGLSGSTAFCLKGSIMSNVPLALGSTMWQFVEAQMFNDAYQVACLGVPTPDWEGLAMAALESLHFQVARDSFVRLRKLPWLELINQLKENHTKGESKENLLGDVLAFQGKFKEASRLYQKGGNSSKALSMYTDLRMFDLAQEFLPESDSADTKIELIRRRAEWACSAHEPRAAAELLLAAGETLKAIKIIAEQGWTDVLLDIGRKSNEKDTLNVIAEQLKKLKALPMAAEIYKKLGEDHKIIQLHTEAKEWDEALKLADTMGQPKQFIHLQHAKYLTESDKFLEAYHVYILGGNFKDATKLLSDLIECAISEERFTDVSYYVWLSAKQTLLEMKNDTEKDLCQMKFKSIVRLASVYYAYSVIHAYLREPFTSSPPLTLFSICRFVANEIGIGNKQPPKGISLFVVLFSLSKQAKTLGATKLQLQVNSKLLSLKVPPGIKDKIDVNYIDSKASSGGFNENEDLLIICYKCSSYSPHLQGNKCPNCQQDYIFSHVSFEILPLVEFMLEQDIDDNEAERLLMAPPKIEHHDSYSDTMVNEEIGDMPSVVDRALLRALDPRSIHIVKGPTLLKPKYYRNVLPELQITFCPSCSQAFHLEDFELQVLQKGMCPFCRAPAETVLGRT